MQLQAIILLALASIALASEQVAPIAETPVVPVAEQPAQVGAQAAPVAPVAHKVVEVASGEVAGPVGQAAPVPLPVPVVVGAPQHYADGAFDKPLKPFGAVSGEQHYGQPEPSSLPANYKPFGSWGLYIGGSPQDGYYTNYYKALGSGADKPVVGVEQPIQASGAAAIKPALSPIFKQASASPFYPGADYYPFSYSAGELSHAPNFGPVGVQQPPVVGVQQPARVGSVSPVQVGAQIYGAPVVGVEPVAIAGPEHYATKSKLAGASKGGASEFHVTKGGQEAIKGQPKQQEYQAVKGHQQQQAYYATYAQAAPVAIGQLANQQVVQGVQQHQQVYAYPVPVGSQIIGSQQGVDGAFAPYGVHAFTRYAVKPTLVHQTEASYYPVVQPAVVAAAAPAQSAVPQAAYKQQQQHQQHQHVYGTQFGFYGYPLNQIGYAPVQSTYYSAPAVVSHQQHQYQHQAAPVSQVVPVQAAGAVAELAAPVQQQEKQQEAVDDKAFGSTKQ